MAESRETRADRQGSPRDRDGAGAADRAARQGERAGVEIERGPARDGERSGRGGPSAVELQRPRLNRDRAGVGERHLDVGRPGGDRLLQHARVHECVRAGSVADVGRGLEVERPCRVVLDRAAADRRSIEVVTEVEIAVSRHIERARVFEHAAAVECDITGGGIRRRPLKEGRPRSGLLIVIAAAERRGAGNRQRARAGDQAARLRQRGRGPELAAIESAPPVTASATRDRGPGDIRRAARHLHEAGAAESVARQREGAAAEIERGPARHGERSGGGRAAAIELQRSRLNRDRASVGERDLDVGRPGGDRLLQHARVHECVRAGSVADAGRGWKSNVPAGVVLGSCRRRPRSIEVVTEVEIAVSRHIERARVFEHAPAVECDITGGGIRRRPLKEGRPRSGLLIVIAAAERRGAGNRQRARAGDQAARLRQGGRGSPKSQRSRACRP